MGETSDGRWEIWGGRNSGRWAATTRGNWMQQDRLKGKDPAKKDS